MDSMTFYQMIGLTPEDMRLLEECARRLPLKELDSLLDGMTCAETAERAYLELKDRLAAYRLSRQEKISRKEKISQQEKDGSTAGTDRLDSYEMLFCHLESARRVHEKYISKGIPERIFIDTMKCFPRFMDECEVRNRRRYFERSFWTWRQTGMLLFRIGALEYEMVKSSDGGGREYEMLQSPDGGGREHEMMQGPDGGGRGVHLHIPSDADLSGPAVDESLRGAEAFFRNYYPEYDGVEYSCGSWLLSPALRELLPAGSRILAFQRRFKIDRVDETDTSYVRWLFQSPNDVPLGDLPERTGLQRAAKAYLLAGGKIGAGYGNLL